MMIITLMYSGIKDLLVLFLSPWLKIVGLNDIIKHNEGVLMRIKKILIIFLLLFNINVLASNETDITNVKINGESITCNNLICSGTVNDTKVKIEYQMVDPAATSSGFKSGETFDIPGESITKKLTVSKTMEGLETPLSSEYTFNITKHLTSNDTSLKKLTINDRTIKVSKDVFVYNVEVKYDVEELKVEIVPNSSYAKYEITSSLSFPLEESSKAFDFIVRSEQGKEKEYRVIIKREDGPDVTLKKLRISSGEVKLERGVTDYQINVPYDVNTLDLEVETNDPNATYELSKNDNDLIIGDNKISITVHNKDIEQVYNLTITRFENTGEGVVNLSNLEIAEYEDFNFKVGNTEYDLYFEKIPLHLTIKTERANKESEVEIEGNSNLKDGSEIKIKVIQKRLNMSKEYLLHIHKGTEKKKSSTLMTILIILAIIVLIGIIVTLLIIKKRKNKNPKKNKVDKIKKEEKKKNRKEVVKEEKKKEKEIKKTKEVNLSNPNDDDLEVI